MLNAVITAFNMERYALIKWIEDPPKWDVVLTNDFHPKGRVFNINDVCDVTYGNGTSPAEILKYGKHRSVPK